MGKSDVLDKKAKSQKKEVWIRTQSKPHMYVHNVHGVCFLSWVMEHNKAEAETFPDDQSWVTLLGSIAGCELERVKIAQR